MRSLTLPTMLLMAVCTLVTSATRAESQTPRTVRYTKSSFGANISRSVLTVADTANHSLIQSFRIDSGHTDAPDFVIVQERVWLQGEVRGTTTRFAGYTVLVMLGGEQVSLRWSADATPSGVRDDGEPATESGTVVILGGTGRFAVIRGRGIYRAYAKGPVLEETLLDIVY